LSEFITATAQRITRVVYAMQSFQSAITRKVAMWELQNNSRQAKGKLIFQNKQFA